MHQRHPARICILVKAYPQPSQKYEETVCCAGITDTGELLRLYPVPYRHLSPEQRFGRFDVIQAIIDRDTGDFRPESHKVDPDSISIVQHEKDLDEIAKVRLWAPFVVQSLVQLKEENQATHRSLGIIKPDAGSLKFRVKRHDRNPEDEAVFAAMHSQQSIFNEKPLPALKMEYQFGYSFTCAGVPHEMKLHDWEVQATYFNYKKRYGSETLSKMRNEFEVNMPQRNLHFVMGTMKAHPRQFIVIGMLRSSISPEAAMRQSSLF